MESVFQQLIGKDQNRSVSYEPRYDCPLCWDKGFKLYHDLKLRIWAYPCSCRKKIERPEEKVERKKSKKPWNKTLVLNPSKDVPEVTEWTGT